MSSVLRKSDRIFVAGHRGMVGSAILKRLRAEGYENLITCGRDELDLLDQAAVEAFFRSTKVDHVVLAAAKVGGIYANSEHPAPFIHENLIIQSNIIGSAQAAGVHRLLFLGSSCIYPKLAKQPMSEDQLLTGYLEPTNEPYALAKIAGIKLCESFNRQFGTQYRSVMPTNLYGPGDNFHPLNSHVVPALMRRFHEACEQGVEEVEVWGTGKATREFLYVDDMAEACLHVMALADEEYEANTQPMLSHINVGTGVGISIADLATKMAEVVGYTGRINFDTSKPDGTPLKVLDVSRLADMGWRSSTDFDAGLEKTYQWFLQIDHDALREK